MQRRHLQTKWQTLNSHSAWHRTALLARIMKSRETQGEIEAQMEAIDIRLKTLQWAQRKALQVRCWWCGSGSGRQLFGSVSTGRKMKKHLARCARRQQFKEGWDGES